MPTPSNQAVKPTGRPWIASSIQSQAVSARTRSGSDSTLERNESTSPTLSSMLLWRIPHPTMRTDSNVENKMRMLIRLFSRRHCHSSLSDSLRNREDWLLTHFPGVTQPERRRMSLS